MPTQSRQRVCAAKKKCQYHVRTVFNLIFSLLFRLLLSLVLSWLLSSELSFADALLRCCCRDDQWSELLIPSAQPIVVVCFSVDTGHTHTQPFTQRWSATFRECIDAFDRVLFLEIDFYEPHERRPLSLRCHHISCPFNVMVMCHRINRNRNLWFRPHKKFCSTKFNRLISHPQNDKIEDFDKISLHISPSLSVNGVLLCVWHCDQCSCGD